MHKYQPRIHVIRTSDLAQIPWAPQQAFVFPETEFVAVTAYQVSFLAKKDQKTSTVTFTFRLVREAHFQFIQLVNWLFINDLPITCVMI